ncbi:hypothetical protein Plhal304r1_c015g0055461 [Plasmopara halstedii]
MHFGNTSTLRVEGSHAYIKTFLQTSTGDLLTIVSKITIALKHQLKAEELRCLRQFLKKSLFSRWR